MTTSDRYATARSMTERAIRAQSEGDDDQADQLFADAARIDPEAVAAALADSASNPADTATGADAAPQDDDEIAAMTRTIEPRSDAPARAGLTGPGSGADQQGT